MGHDHNPQPNSSGVAIAVIVVILLFAGLGVIVVGGAAVFFVRTERMATQEAHRAVVIARDEATAAAMESEHAMALDEARREPSGVAPHVEAALIEVHVDQLGTLSIDGESIELADLETHLLSLKKTTDAGLSLQVKAVSECPVRHVVAILDICERVGGIDCSVVLSGDSAIDNDEDSSDC